MLKIFNMVWVILMIESEMESKIVNFFKVMVKFVLFFKCGDEFYILLILVIEKFLKKRGVRGYFEVVGVFNSIDDV